MSPAIGVLMRWIVRGGLRVDLFAMAALSAWLLGSLCGSSSRGQVLAVASTPSPAQLVNLPFAFHDDVGSNWDIQPDGSIGDGGNDLYDGGAKLLVNNQPFQPSGAQPTMDAAHNEIVIPPMTLNGLNITRRISVNAHQSWCRYVEVLENSAGQAQHVELRLTFSMGGPPTMLQPVDDPKKKDRQVGLALGNPQNNFVTLIGAGRGSAMIPQFQAQQGVKDVALVYQIDVPAKKTVAVVWVQLRRPTFDQASKANDEIKDGDYLNGIDPALAKVAVNFRRTGKMIGDEEILRGEISDIVELRGGDQYKGTLKETGYHLTTTYGPIDLPAERVVSLINTGRFRPRQLIVTVDGEVFGGELQTSSLKLEMSSGQTIDVPLKEIARLGYRKRAGEPEEWVFNRPMVSLRTGERMIVGTPSAPFELLTRFGRVQLKSSCVQAIVFESDEHASQEIHLTDGSEFTALLEAPELEFRLMDTTSSQAVKIPCGAIARLQVAPPNPSDDAEKPALTLANNETLVGTLTGAMKLDTAFDTITVNAEQIAHLQRIENSTTDVQVTLWDKSTVSGQLETASLRCALNCGTELDVPVAIVQQYVQPLPQPSAAEVERIKAAVADLDADDWKQRDRAQAVLMEMGPAVCGELNKLRSAQPAEAQGRIDAILDQLNKIKKAASATPPAALLNKD